MNKKYYINYEKEERECGKCGAILPFSDFPMSPYLRPTTYCKKCKSKMDRENFINSKEKSLHNN